MATRTTLAETTTKTGRTNKGWHIVPAKKPNCFVIENIATGRVKCTLSFTEGSDTSLLNLFKSAPDLQDIAEMFRDSMVGCKAEKTMVFSIVKKVLGDIQ